MVRFGEFLKARSLRTNSVTRQVKFNRTKIGGKCQNSKIQMRHFTLFKQCDTLQKSLKKSYFAIFLVICLLTVYYKNNVNLFLFILSEHKMIDDEVTLLSSLDLALFKSCPSLFLYNDSPALHQGGQQQLLKWNSNHR